MTHHPYEDWLFSEETPNPQEQAALQEHLESCAACRLLATAWRGVESEMRAAPRVEPEPGFTARWQARLESDRQRLHRRQSLLLLGFILFGVALIFASMFFLAIPLLNAPEIYFLTWLYRLLSFFSTVTTVQEVGIAILKNVTDNFPIIWWVFFAGLVSELAVLWVVSLRLLTNPRRVTK